MVMTKERFVLQASHNIALQIIYIDGDSITIYTFKAPLLILLNTINIIVLSVSFQNCLLLLIFSFLFFFCLWKTKGEYDVSSGFKTFHSGQVCFFVCFSFRVKVIIIHYPSKLSFCVSLKRITVELK